MTSARRSQFKEYGNGWEQPAMMLSTLERMWPFAISVREGCGQPAMFSAVWSSGGPFCLLLSTQYAALLCRKLWRSLWWFCKRVRVPVYPQETHVLLDIFDNCWGVRGPGETISNVNARKSERLNSFMCYNMQFWQHMETWSRSIHLRRLGFLKCYYPPDKRVGSLEITLFI